MKYFDISDFKFLTPYEIKDPIWVKSADGVFLKFSKCEGFIDCTRPMKNGNWHTQYQFSRGHKYEHLEFANRRSESSFMFIFQRELGDEEYFTKKITSVDPQKTIHFKTFPDGTREHYYQTDNEAIIEVFEPSGFLRSRTLETHSTEEKCLFSKGYIKSITYKKIRPDETQCTVILFNKGKPIRVVNYIDEFTHQKGSMYRRHQKIIPNGLQAVYRRKKWFIQYRIGDTIIDEFVRNQTEDFKIISTIDANMLHLIHPNVVFEWPQIISEDISKFDPRNIRFCGWKVNNCAPGF